jgi:hypothetical protein
MRIYCVRRISTGECVYCGKSWVSTATALEPGTAYGWGPTRELAQRDSEIRAAQFRDVGWRPLAESA